MIATRGSFNCAMLWGGERKSFVHSAIVIIFYLLPFHCPLPILLLCLLFLFLPPPFFYTPAHSLLFNYIVRQDYIQNTTYPDHSEGWRPPWAAVLRHPFRSSTQTTGLLPRCCQVMKSKGEQRNAGSCTSVASPITAPRVCDGCLAALCAAKTKEDSLLYAYSRASRSDQEPKKTCRKEKTAKFKVSK